MAKEVVYKVKEAEDIGGEIIRNANEKAKRIVEDAETEGSVRFKEALREAGSLREAMLREAAREADEECVPLEEKNAAEIAGILNPESEKFERAVKTVMERIVK